MAYLLKYFIHFLTFQMSVLQIFPMSQIVDSSLLLLNLQTVVTLLKMICEFDGLKDIIIHFI